MFGILEQRTQRGDFQGARFMGRAVDDDRRDVVLNEESE